LKVVRCGFLVATVACLLQAQPLMTDEGVKGNLVTVNWLEKHLNNPDVLILDASPAPAYAAKHIPGAVSVDLMSYGAQEIPVADREKRYQSWGISPGKTIVFYDPGGAMLATRLLFSLYYDGFPAERLFILDGGLFKWEEQKLPVAKDVPSATKPGSFRIEKLNKNANAELPEFLTASGDTVKNALLDALGADWHFGAVLALSKAGHIPNGILLPSADFYNPDRTFKSAEEIRKMLTYVGVRPEQQIYTYCGGGVAASVPFFAVKFILNYPHVKLYTGSELDWLSDERELPYWTYDAPSLMREANWLQFSSGPMPRAAGITQVSIVDVRPADVFNRGHVPFALNVPADVFKSNLTHPEKLAEILGPAGVNAPDEALVISGKGLTKESALAFLVLDKLGQKKVSVFIDSMEKWAQLGFGVTTNPTAVGPKKGPQDVSIPPTTYPANFRKDVVIADPKNTQGVYPKLFVASGANLPARALDGKVVHVPYTDLLNPDGTPKTAKDIWTVLVKAGVTRYAELVCFSDDPGEAAVNYFILKLMGYPDIKVLVM